MRSRLARLAIGVLMLMASTRHSAFAAVVPDGTAMNIRTTHPITADASHVGMKVDGVVDDPVTDASGGVIIPRGAPATLEIIAVHRSSNLKGRDRMTLKVLSVAVSGRSYTVATSTVEVKGPSEGKRAAWKIGGGAGIGAAVGGLLGGGTGALVGATAGGTTGAIVAGSGKTHLIVPAETRLHFRFAGPARIAH